MQGEKIFKEGQRLTPVFEMHREKRESCEKKQTIISIEAIVASCTLNFPIPI